MPAVCLALVLGAARPVSAAGTPGWDPWGVPEGTAPGRTAGLTAETNAGRIAGMVAIRIYQLSHGRDLPGGCQFEPSCSAYTLRCVAMFGLVNGTWMGADRISRCHGFALLGGYQVSRSGHLLDSPEEAAPPLPVLGALGL